MKLIIVCFTLLFLFSCEDSLTDDSGPKTPVEHAFELYKNKLLNLPIKTQIFTNKNIKHAYHLFLMAIDKRKTKKNRDDLILFLKKHKIGCGVNYRSVTDMSVFRKRFGWNNKTCKNSKYLGDNTLSLPLYPDLTIKDVNYICEKIQEFFKS